VALIIPNIDRISKDNPRLGEALLKVQQYTNQNVPAVAGNAVSPPTFVNPAKKT
jgi:hypothetical protein